MSKITDKKISLQLSVRRLLTYSNYLLGLPITESIRKKLESNAEDLFTDEEFRRYKNNIESWMSQCRAEWKHVKGPVKIEKNHSDRCQLCNQKLTAKKVNVKNRINNRELWIGVECCKVLFDEENRLRYANRTPEQNQLVEQFMHDNLDIDQFLKALPSKTGKYTRSYIDLRDEKNLVEEINNYISHNIITKKYNAFKLNKLKSKISKCYDSFKEYDTKNTDHKLKKAYENIVVAEQDNGTWLIEQIQKNKGILEQDTAQLIQATPFLIDYASNQSSNSLCLSASSFGILDISFEFDGLKLLLPIESGTVIQGLGYPLNFEKSNNDYLISELCRKGLLIDKINAESKSALKIIGNLAINKSGIESLNLSFKKFQDFVSSKTSGNTEEKLRVSKRTFDELTNNKIYIVSSDNVIEVKNKDLRMIGIKMVQGNDTYESARSVLSDLKPYRTINDLYQSIYNDMQLKEIV